MELKKLKEFDIAFEALQEGEHQFQFEIGREIFDFYDYTDFNDISAKGNLTLRKESTYMKMNFDLHGTIGFDCDRCTAPFQLPVECTEKVVVKFSGRDIDSKSEEIIYMSISESIINVASFFYEMIILTLPLKRSHESDDCDQEVLNQLEEWSVRNEETEEIDPRWEALKKLKQR